MKITYHIDDGYVGGDRPQHIQIDESDVFDIENEADAEALIDEMIEQHFQERITPYMKGSEREKAVAWIMSQVEKQKEEEESND